MRNIINKFRDSKVYSYTKPLLFVIFMVQTYIWFGKYGLLGVVIAILLIMGVRIIISRNLFMYHLKEVEKVIWKKPLDKKEWEKDEMKNTKVKIKWRKKDGKKK